MKKKMTLVISVICILSLLCNGILLYQNNKYQTMEEELHNLKGWISYYAMHDLNYFSDVAYMYRLYLDKIVKGEYILEDLFHYSDGIAERVERMTGLHDLYFDDMESAQKEKLMTLIYDCNRVLCLTDKHEILLGMSDEQLKELSTCYGTIERLLNANYKSGVVHYWREKDYTGVESIKVQSELRVAIDNIDALLDKQNTQSAVNDTKLPVSATAQVIQIEGKFVAKVRDVLPNYVLDDTTPHYVVVTMFQDGPFLINVGALADDLEIGKVYSFEITPKKLGKMNTAELDYTLLSPARAIPAYNLHMERIHEVSEETYSQNDMQLIYAPVE